jgi:hypothetical protein
VHGFVGVCCLAVLTSEHLQKIAETWCCAMCGFDNSCVFDDECTMCFFKRGHKSEPNSEEVDVESGSDADLESDSDEDESPLQHTSRRTFTVTFGEGPLGLGIAQMMDGDICALRVSGQCEKNGVHKNDVVIAVNETCVIGMIKDQVVGLIKSKPRSGHDCLAITFVSTYQNHTSSMNDTSELKREGEGKEINWTMKMLGTLKPEMLQTQNLLMLTNHAHTATTTDDALGVTLQKEKHIEKQRQNGRVYTLTFEEGKLGLGLAVMADGSFEVLRISGQCEEKGVQVHDKIVAVNSKPIGGKKMDKKAVLALIASTPRTGPFPLTITFEMAEANNWGGASPEKEEEKPDLCSTGGMVQDKMSWTMRTISTFKPELIGNTTGDVLMLTNRPFSETEKWEQEEEEEEVMCSRAQLKAQHAVAKYALDNQ